MCPLEQEGRPAWLYANRPLTTGTGLLQPVPVASFVTALAQGPRSIVETKRRKSSGFLKDGHELARAYSSFSLTKAIFRAVRERRAVVRAAQPPVEAGRVQRVSQGRPRRGRQPGELPGPHDANRPLALRRVNGEAHG